MNPESPQSSSEAFEARITALLLGELTADDAAEVQRSIEAKSELRELHDRLRQTIGLLQQAGAADGWQFSAANRSESDPAPLAGAVADAGFNRSNSSADRPTQGARLSEERRQFLLGKFRSRATEIAPPARRSGFPWYVPMSIAAGLMLLLALNQISDLNRRKSKGIELAEGSVITRNLLSEREMANRGLSSDQNQDIANTRKEDFWQQTSAGAARLKEASKLTLSSAPAPAAPPPSPEVTTALRSTGREERGVASERAGGDARAFRGEARDPMLANRYGLRPTVVAGNLGEIQANAGSAPAEPTPANGPAAGGGPRPMVLGMEVKEAMIPPSRSGAVELPPQKSREAESLSRRGDRSEKLLKETTRSRPSSTLDSAAATAPAAPAQAQSNIRSAGETTAKPMPAPSPAARAPVGKPVQVEGGFARLSAINRVDGIAVDEGLLQSDKKVETRQEVRLGGVPERGTRAMLDGTAAVDSPKAAQDDGLGKPPGIANDGRLKTPEALAEFSGAVGSFGGGGFGGRSVGGVGGAPTVYFHQPRPAPPSPATSDFATFESAKPDSGVPSTRVLEQRERALGLNAVADTLSTPATDSRTVASNGRLNVSADDRLKRGGMEAADGANRAQLGKLTDRAAVTEERSVGLEKDVDDLVAKFNNGSPADRKNFPKSKGVMPAAKQEVAAVEAKPAPITLAFDGPAATNWAVAPVPQPEVVTGDNAFSTFSLNVTDVSFKLAAASLEQGTLPDPASIRSEEFINAFKYRDPEAAPGVPIAFVQERAQYPFAHNRELLRFSIRTAVRGREPSRPLNLVLLLDNSGSMERVDRVQTRRAALGVLAAQLQPQDRISVVTFARTPRLWVDALAGDQAGNLAERVGDLAPEGGTNLEEALNLAYATAVRHFLGQGVNRVVLMTDGAANLGDVDPGSLKQKVQSWRQRGVALDCFGIGWEGLNDDLLELLSRHGDGRYGFVNSPEEVAGNFAAQLAGALQVAAADVKVQVEFNPQRVSQWRQVGYARHQLTKEQFRDNTVDAAELAAAESGNALYVVEVNAAGHGPLATVRARYRDPQSGVYRENEWPVPYTGQAPALERAPAALRLAATASAFSEWLARSPFAGEVTPDALLKYLQGVPEAFNPDPTPARLQAMLRQAQSLSGK